MAIAAFNNDIQLFGAGVTSGAAMVQAGKIIPLGVTWSHSLSSYPDAPPLDRDVPGFRANNIQLLLAPKGTPRHIVEYYNQVFRVAAKTNKSQERFNKLSIVAVDLDVDQTTQALKKEQEILHKSAKLVDLK
jgi:tripartite-type tricarboxylate transporter receptor subunit TctC